MAWHKMLVSETNPNRAQAQTRIEHLGGIYFSNSFRTPAEFKKFVFARLKSEINAEQQMRMRTAYSRY